MKAAVIVRVDGGCAEAFYDEREAEVYIVDTDSIDAGDEPVALPKTARWRELAETASLVTDEQVVFGDNPAPIDPVSALADCVTQMQQCAKMFAADKEFVGVLRRAERALRRPR